MMIGVIGANGFIGSAICAECDSQGVGLQRITRQNYASCIGSHLDVLVNANGNSRKYLAVRDPHLDFSLSVESVSRTMKDFDVGVYVYLSSIDVYPAPSSPATTHEGIPIDRKAGISAYGFHKLLAEDIVMFHKKRWLVLRMGGFVGPGIWKNSIYDMLHNQPLYVHPDSRYQYLNTRDLASILLKLVNEGKHNQIYNVAGNGTMRLTEIADMIPGATFDDKAFTKDVETYDVSIDKLSRIAKVPDTSRTVRSFVSEFLNKSASSRDNPESGASAEKTVEC